MHGIPETSDDDQAATLPFASRYLKCTDSNHELCNLNENRFRAVCWIDREDVTPTKKQLAKPPSQVSWHPGFRVHQLMGRAMAMVILTALEDAINTWSEVTIVGKCNILISPSSHDFFSLTDHLSFNLCVLFLSDSRGASTVG
jgi:hypothetical protein